MPQNVYVYTPFAFVPKNAQHIEIPEGITEISNGAFRDCSALRSITIPDGVTKIGDYAFSDCINLQSVVIPDGITEISDYAFNNCHNLQFVTMPNSITGIGHYAFFDCHSLQSVTIPDGVTEIGDHAFCECSAIRSVTIPGSVAKMGSHTFSGCKNLQSVVLSDGVTEIGHYAFDDCYSLQSVVMPDSLTKIGLYAFYDCHSLQSVIIPNSVTSIWEGAFAQCSALQSITIPDGITEIAYVTFIACSGLRSVIISDGVTEIGDGAFSYCSSLRSVTIPDSVTTIKATAFERCSSLRSLTIPDSVTCVGDMAFRNCPSLRLLLSDGTDIAPFININGYGVSAFDIIKTLTEHRIPLTENTVRFGIDMQHRGKLVSWMQDYPTFGKMRVVSSAGAIDAETKEDLQQLFAGLKRTGYHIPKILNELAAAVRTGGIPPERLAERFDVVFTKNLLENGIPLVPAEVCRCYYDRGICDTLIQKDKLSVMAETISLYNESGHSQCYRHLMDFIISHTDTKTDLLMYAVDHAAGIPMEAGTTLAQIKQHQTHTKNLAEVTRIEAKYGKIIPGFRLSDYPCSIEPVGITYNGMTARVLDLSDGKDIALATRLGELTNCCQCFDCAGETAMMHGFLNPDAGFWIIEDGDGTVKAQAEIWKSDGSTLVFDNIEFADTDNNGTPERMNQLRNIIAAWAEKSGYGNIIMGCGYNALGTETMEQAPVPALHLTPQEILILQEDNDAGVSFGNVDEVYRYMQTAKYRPQDFVYTDADEQCVYIKKDGVVSDYLMQGYDRSLINTSDPGKAEQLHHRSPDNQKGR